MTDENDDPEIEFDIDAFLEAANTPSLECGHCGGQTEFQVEFRDLTSDDEPRQRSLCSRCVMVILEWI